MSSVSQYEAPDESSENDLLSQSLSLWKGFGGMEDETFSPIPLDIHTAACIGQHDCVKEIIDSRAVDLDRPNPGGWTPLMYASYIGHERIVLSLLEAGAKVNKTNGRGQTPFLLSASCGNDSVAYLLLRAGADLEGSDNKGWTALFHATYSGHQNMAKLLLDHGADPMAREPRGGFTPFMEAAAAGHEIIIQYFLLQDVDVHMRSFTGHTARSLAVENGHTKIVSLLDNHVLGPSLPLRAHAQLHSDHELSLSDNRRHAPRKYHGPRIQDGPDAINKVFDKVKRSNLSSSNPDRDGLNQSRESPGRHNVDGSSELQDSFHFHDVSPSESRDRSLFSEKQADPEDELSAFTKTGALTIRSSSGSSGGLVASLGLSSTSSDQSSEAGDTDLSASGSSCDNPGLLHRSLSDSVLRGFENLRSQNTKDPGDLHYSRPRSPPGFSRDGDPYSVPASQTERVPKGPSTTQPPHTDYPQYTPFGGTRQLFPSGAVTQQPSKLDQGHLPPSYPLSMLQHPLWNDPGTSSIQDNRADATATDSPLPTHTSRPPSHPALATKALPTEPKEAHLPGQASDLSGRPADLAAILDGLGLGKYRTIFEEQDVDLQVFLSLTDNDLKEVGIKLFGPRRKMTNAIARWHSNTRSARNDLEQAYADKLETAMQEMAIQLKLAKEEVSQLKQQVRQESELRSVTEGCLVKDRVTWQHVRHLASDSQQCCSHIQERLSLLRLYQIELASRVQVSPQSSLTGSGSRNSLAAALKEGLSLDNNQQPIPAEISKLSTHHLVLHVIKLTSDLESIVGVAAMNVGKLLQATPSTLPSQS